MEPRTVLVADSVDDRRRSLGLALYEGGYEVINAVNGEEALRFTAGLNPALVVAAARLDGLDAMALRGRLAATGLAMPPMLVLCDEWPSGEEEEWEGAVHFLESKDLDPSRFLRRVRLLFLAQELGGELSDSIDTLYGDLARRPLRELLEVLGRHRISGHITLSVGPNAGIWVADGRVVDAHWAGISGRKAFNRVAGLQGGFFTVKVDDPAQTHVIDGELEGLMREAAEERIELDTLFRALPSLDSVVEIVMSEDFFNAKFEPIEQAVLAQVQEARSLGRLIDRVQETDLDVVRTALLLSQRGFLAFGKPEHRIHVVTDSTCDLPPALTRQLHVSVVPLSVLFGDKVFKDGLDIQPDEFYRLLETSEAMPTASAPGKGELLAVYRRLVASGDIVSIHVSSKQSPTVRHAEEAAVAGSDEYRQLREDSGEPGGATVRIVDSGSISVGLGLMVVLASRLVGRGCSLDEIVKRLETIRSRACFLFVVDTLEYLRKGGLIGSTRALIGGVLGIKPILEIVDGEVVQIDKARGGRKVESRLIELFASRVEPERPLYVALAHAQAPKRAGRLRELLEERFRIEEIVEGEIGPVVGALTGPGTVGCMVFQPTDEELELLRHPTQ